MPMREVGVCKERLDLRHSICHEPSENLLWIDPEFSAGLATDRQTTIERSCSRNRRTCVRSSDLHGRGLQIPEIGRQNSCENEHMAVVLPAGLLEIHKIGCLCAKQGDRSGRPHAGLVISKRKEICRLTHFLVACAAHVAQHFDEEWRTRGVLGNDNADLVAWRLQGKKLRLGASQLASASRVSRPPSTSASRETNGARSRVPILVIERPQVYGLTPDKEQGLGRGEDAGKVRGRPRRGVRRMRHGLVEVNQSDPLMHRYD